jgi:hypothetical protein
MERRHAGQVPSGRGSTRVSQFTQVFMAGDATALWRKSGVRALAPRGALLDDGRTRMTPSRLSPLSSPLALTALLALTASCTSQREAPSRASRATTVVSAPAAAPSAQPPEEARAAATTPIAARAADSAPRLSSGEQLATLTAALEEARAAATEEPGDDVLAWAAKLETLARTLRTAPAVAVERFGDELRTRADALDRRRAALRRRIDPARRARCGPEPELEAAESELEGADVFLERTTHDPSFGEAENCSPPVLTDRACWLTTCEVVHDDAGGAAVTELYEFSIERAGISSAQRAR